MANSWDTEYSSNMGDPQSMQQQPIHEQQLYYQAPTPLYDQQQHQQGRHQFQKHQSPGQTNASANPHIPRTNSNNGLQPPPPPRPNQPPPAGLSRGSSVLSTTTMTPRNSYSSEESHSMSSQPHPPPSQEVACFKSTEVFSAADSLVPFCSQQMTHFGMMQMFTNAVAGFTKAVNAMSDKLDVTNANIAKMGETIVEGLKAKDESTSRKRSNQSPRTNVAAVAKV